MEELVLNVTSLLVFCAFVYIVHMTAMIYLEEKAEEEMRRKYAAMKWKQKKGHRRVRTRR